MGAEAAVANPDAVFGRKVRSDLTGLEAVDAEGDDTDAVRRIIPQAKNFHAMDVTQAVDELRAQQFLVTCRGLGVVRREGVARGSDRRDPQHVRDPAS